MKRGDIITPANEVVDWDGLAQSMNTLNLKNKRNKMLLDRLNIQYIILLVSSFIVPTDLYAWTEGLEEATRALYNGKSTAEQRLFIHEHINEINDMALSGDLPDNLYQSAQGDFFDRNYADLKSAAAQEGLDITMKKPEHFEPGTDTDAPLTRQPGSDTDITVEKLKKVENNYKNNIKQHYEDANLKAPADIPDTNTDILVDPDATTQFEACSKHINDNGGTAYKNPDAVRVEIKTTKGQPISINEASAYTEEVSRLAGKKSTEAKNLRKEASILEKSNPKKARKLRTQAQLADSQASKYINRSNKATNKLRTQHGLDEIPFDNTSSLDRAISNIDKNTGKGRNMLTRKDAIAVGNMQKHASEKASQKFIDSLGDIAKASPHTARDVQKAIAKKLNTMTPSAQGRAIESLERKVGGDFTQSVVKEAKVLKGIKVGKIAKPATASKKVMNVLTKPRTLGASGKKFVAIGYKAVNVTMIAGGAYFMGKDGVYHALKNVTADQTEFEFFVDVYKEAAWHGSGLGYAYEEAEAEELAMWKREIERGEPSESIRKHVTITIGKTIVYLGRDIVVGTLTLPYVFLEYLIGFEDAEKREQYSKAFLAEVRRQVKSKKEFEKALKQANDEGIAYKDQHMYFNCMCSDCGGSLGGFFRPEFQGGGYGPCQCNGPLTIWKTPISSSADQKKYCKDDIRNMNNRISDARMDELHKLAMAENAKSVQKELQEVKQLSQDDEKLNKATELLLAIQPLLYPKDSQDLRKVIEPKLAGKAHLEMQKGNLKNTIKFLEKKNRVAGLPDDRTYPMAQAKTWLKTWESAKEFYFPRIRDYLKNGRLIHVDNTFSTLHENMQPSGENKESLFPPAYKDPDYLALVSMKNEKKQERMSDIGNAWSKSKEYVSQRDPKSAVKLFEDLLNRWEHTNADKAQLQKELVNRLQMFVKNAQAADKYGDRLKKNGDFSEAIESYSKSVAIQEDPAVQQKLDELLEKVAEEKLLAKADKIRQEAEARDKERQEAEVQKMAKEEATDKIKVAQPISSTAETNASGYWQLVEEKGSIGRECTSKERYNDYYRDTVSGFGSHIKITKMVRKENQVYCEVDGEWQRPSEKLYPGSTIELPVTINRLIDTGKYGCKMEIGFDMHDMECGSTGGGGKIGSVTLDRKSPSSIHKAISWKVKEPSQEKVGEKLTIRACYTAQASICGKNRGMKYYYEWMPRGSAENASISGQFADTSPARLDTTGIDGIVDTSTAIAHENKHIEVGGTANGLEPVKMKLSTTAESYGGSDGTITSNATLIFWNVGSKVAGYDRAELYITSTASNGKVQEFHYVGTFEGGPNGDMRLSDGQREVSVSVYGGEKVRVDGTNYSFKIPNPSVFKKD